MNYTKLFLKSVLAGISVTIGCTAYMADQSKLLAGLFFGTGFFITFTSDLELFSIKCSKILDNSSHYFFDLLIALAGNTVGAFFTASLIMLSSTATKMVVANAQTMANNLMSDNFISLLILSFFCGILIEKMYQIYRISLFMGKYIAIFLFSLIIVRCGFFHYVSVIYLFTLGGAWTNFGLKAVGSLLTIALGNAIGAIFFPFFRMLFNAGDIKQQQNNK